MHAEQERLPTEEFERLRSYLAAHRLDLAGGKDAERRLKAVRAQYEPYLQGLGDRLLMPLPPWLSDPAARDNWETSAWRGESHL